MRRTGGFTLAEVLVGTGILSLVLVVGARMTAGGVRAWNADQVRSSVESAAVVLERRMAAELLITARESVTTVASPPAVSFLQPLDYDPDTGGSRWAGFVVYFLDGPNQVLYRKVWPRPGGGLQVPPLPYTFPADQPMALTAAELQLVATTNNGTETRAARDVTDLSVQPGDWSTPGTLLLQFAVPTRSGVETRVRRLSLNFRNR